MNSKTEPGYYYEMDNVQERSFVDSMRRLHLGQTYEEVVTVIGKPDHDQVLQTKAGGFVARVLTFYVKKWEKDLVNEKHDWLVRLEFDTNGLLTRIVSNVAGISNK